jgi:hypothetical protein
MNVTALRSKLSSEKQVVADCETELFDLQQRVADMRAVVASLDAAASGNVDQLERQKQIQMEIDTVEAQLLQEVKEQRTIRKTLEQLKKESPDLQATPLKSQLQIPQPVSPMSTSGSLGSINRLGNAGSYSSPSLHDLKKPASHVFGSNNGSSSSSSLVDTKKPVPNVFGSRVEREMQLILLRKRLESERKQTEQLRAIAALAKQEVERALEMARLHSQQELRAGAKPIVPKWIQMLNEHSNKSATIRKLAKHKADSAVDLGGVMSFRDKILFFTSAQDAKSPVEQDD